MQYLTRNMSERYLIKNRTNSPDIDSLILVCMQRFKYVFSMYSTYTHSYTHKRTRESHTGNWALCSTFGRRTTTKLILIWTSDDSRSDRPAGRTQTWIKDTLIHIQHIQHMYKFSSFCGRWDIRRPHTRYLCVRHRGPSPCLNKTYTTLLSVLRFTVRTARACLRLIGARLFMSKPPAHTEYCLPHTKWPRCADIFVRVSRQLDFLGFEQKRNKQKTQRRLQSLTEANPAWASGARQCFYSQKQKRHIDLDGRTTLRNGDYNGLPCCGDFLFFCSPPLYMSVVWRANVP